MSQVRILSSRPLRLLALSAPFQPLMDYSPQRPKYGRPWAIILNSNRGCGSMVEPEPSKLMTRVRFPSAAPETARPPTRWPFHRRGTPRNRTREGAFRQAKAPFGAFAGKPAERLREVPKICRRQIFRFPSAAPKQNSRSSSGFDDLLFFFASVFNVPICAIFEKTDGCKRPKRLAGVTGRAPRPRPRARCLRSSRRLFRRRRSFPRRRACSPRPSRRTPRGSATCPCP